MISPYRSAFVGGRFIQDNIIIVKEAFNFLKRANRKKSGWMGLNLDLNMAFNKIEWPFLEMVMLALVLTKIGLDLLWNVSPMFLIELKLMVAYLKRLAQLEVGDKGIHFLPISSLWK